MKIDNTVAAQIL